MKPEILYQDKHIAVVVKPAGVMSESPGMPELLRDSLGGQFFCVHRLDAGVGGVMVYARSGQAAARLSAAVAQRELTKEYLAVVQGRPEQDRGWATARWASSPPPSPMSTPRKCSLRVHPS